MGTSVHELPSGAQEFAAGLRPLFEALETSRNRALQRQQVLAQIGQLTLEQEKFKEEQAQRKEQQAALEETALSAKAAYEKLNKPELGDIVAHAIRTGNQGVLQAALGVQSTAKDLQTQATLSELGKALGLDNESPLMQFFAGAAAADPRGLGAASVSAMGNLASVQAKPKTQRWIKERIIGADGVPMSTLINPDTKERIVVGRMGPSYAEQIDRVGTATQQGKAVGALAFRNAFHNIKKLSGDNAVRQEATTALNAIEAASRIGSIPFIGDLASFGGRTAIQAGLSDEANVLVNNFFDILAAQGFGKGGAQLTKMEWDRATQSYMPLAADGPKAIQDKLDRLDRVGRSQVAANWNAFQNMLPELFDQDEAAYWAQRFHKRSGASSGGSPSPSTPPKGQDALSRLEALAESLMRPK